MVVETRLPLRAKHRLTEAAANQLHGMLVGTPVRMGYAGVNVERTGEAPLGRVVAVGLPVEGETGWIVPATVQLDENDPVAMEAAKQVQDGVCGFGVDASVKVQPGGDPRSDSLVVIEVYRVDGLNVVPMDGNTRYRGRLQEQ